MQVNRDNTLEQSIHVRNMGLTIPWGDSGGRDASQHPKVKRLG